MPSISRPPVVKADLSGKTIAVIGCSTGIGLEIAKHFATMNPSRLILGCRSQERADATVLLVKETTGFAGTEGWVIDLSSYKSVVAFAERFEKDSVPLDIFVYNAAVAYDRFQKTPDGWEEMLQVNHISAALLTLLLLPNLLQSAEKSRDLSRVTIVSSGAHATSKFTKEDIPGDILTHLNNEKLFEGKVLLGRYPESKLLNVLFTRALASHLPSNAPAIVDTACPGFCLSDLRRNLDPEAYRHLWEPYMANAKTSEEGSRSVIYAVLGPQGATRDDLKKLHGGYISEAQLEPPSEWVRSEDGKRAQEEAWIETVKIVSAVAPSVEGIVKKYAAQ